MLAEVHWADLTRAGAGTHHFIASLVRFVYGLHHVVTQAAVIPGRVGAALDGTLRVALFLLLGPASALFLFEAVLYLVYPVFVPNRWDGENRAASLWLLAAFAACGAAFGWAKRRAGGSVLWPSPQAVGLAALAHSVFRLTGVAGAWYARAVLPLLNVPPGQTPGEWPLLGFVIDAALDPALGSVAGCVILAGALDLRELFLDATFAESRRGAGASARPGVARG